MDISRRFFLEAGSVLPGAAFCLFDPETPANPGVANTPGDSHLCNRHASPVPTTGLAALMMMRA
jgi:hypothetical protein